MIIIRAILQNKTKKKRDNDKTAATGVAIVHTLTVHRNRREKTESFTRCAQPI